MKHSRRKQSRKSRNSKKNRNSRRMGGMTSEEERKLNDLSLSVEEHIKLWQKINPFGPTTKHWVPSTYDNGYSEYNALRHREKIRFYLKKLKAIRQAGSDEMIEDPDPRLEPYTAKLNSEEEAELS